MDFLKQFMCEDNGNLSSMRLIMLLVICTVLFNWTYMNIIKETLHSFQIIDLGALGIPMLFKMMQKGKEQEVK